jgi:ABC-type uncharacterized transport system involved in gliding motility auxiliary subunit
MKVIREYSPYIALFGLFLLVASPLVNYLAERQGQQIPELLAPALAVVGIVLMLVWPFSRPDDVRRLVGSRRSQFGANALILVIAVIGILVVFNFLGTLRYRIWDMTENQQFSISNQTIQVLENLDQPVRLTAVYGFQQSIEEIEDVEQLIDKYRERTGNITFETIVTQYDYQEFEQLNQRIDGNAPSSGLVAESGDKHAIVFAFDEQAVTEAIVKATREKDVTVYFTSGHGEHNPSVSDQSGRSYTAVGRALEQLGYVVETLEITTTLPAADAIVVAGPTNSFLPQEAELLAEYVDDGGALMIMADPNVDAGLDPILEPLDLQLNDDWVLDPGSVLGPNWIPITDSGYRYHNITEDLREVASVLLNTRSLEVGVPVTTSLQTTTLVESADRAWGETDLESLRSEDGPSRDEEADNPGPIALGVAAEGGDDYGRMVVFGTSELASDGVIGQFGQVFANAGLFLNSISWLTEQEELISVPPKEPSERPLNPPDNPWLLFILTVVAAPLTVLALGGWIMYSRR